MDDSQQLKWKSRARFVLKWALIVELSWLVVVNALLQIPLTQDIVNRIKPEKFFTTWESAWSPWPGRVYAREVAGHGVSRSQIWSFSADRVSGGISFVPLIFKRVWLHNLSGENLDFRQRPRPKPDKDYSAIEAWFPDIPQREITPAETGPYKSKRPWRLRIRNAELTGQHEYWIFNIRGSARGSAGGGMDFVTRGGELEMDIGQVDLELARHTINGDRVLFDKGQLSGALGFLPFVPREHKGISLLDYLLLDAEVDIDANDLSFINLFLLSFENVTVAGSGLVQGRLHLDEGWVQPGTDLKVDANDLASQLLDLGLAGDGRVELIMGSEEHSEMELRILFNGITATHVDDDQPTLAGEQLELVVGGNGKLVPDVDHINMSRWIAARIDRLTVPDLALLQRYLPTEWPLRVFGGEGELSGEAEMRPTSISTDLLLQSDHADVALRDYRFDTNLEAALKLENPDVTRHRTRISGTYLALNESSLTLEGVKAEDPWSSALRINEGRFGIFERHDRAIQENVIDLFGLLSQTPAASLIADSSGEFDFTLDVSSLEWLNVFLGGAQGARFEGSSQANGLAVLKSGVPVAGTHLALESENLSFSILDYKSTGSGVIRLAIEESGEVPDWRLGLSLDGAEMKNVAVPGPAYIKDVDLRLDALVRDVNFDLERKRDFDISLVIPSARVTDLSVFNQDLPPDSPFQFTDGEAELTVDILLQENDAKGGLTLTAPAITAQIDDQEIDAALAANITISGGSPGKREFHFDGSEIRLDNVKVKGSNTDFDESDWSAQLLLTHGRTTWASPISMNFEADLVVSDSRPFVALFDNQGWRPDFLTRAMTIEDITGKAFLHMANQRIVIPSATVGGEEVEISAKAEIEEGNSKGMIYFRYSKADALLRFENEDRNLDVLRVKEKFEEYQPDSGDR